MYTCMHACACFSLRPKVMGACLPPFDESRPKLQVTSRHRSPQRTTSPKTPPTKAPSFHSSLHLRDRRGGHRRRGPLLCGRARRGQADSRRSGLLQRRRALGARSPGHRRRRRPGDRGTDLRSPWYISNGSIRAGARGRSSAATEPGKSVRGSLMRQCKPRAPKNK